MVRENVWQQWCTLLGSLIFHRTLIKAYIFISTVRNNKTDSTEVIIPLNLMETMDKVVNVAQKIVSALLIILLNGSNTVFYKKNSKKLTYNGK